MCSVVRFQGVTANGERSARSSPRWTRAAEKMRARAMERREERILKLAHTLWLSRKKWRAGGGVVEPSEGTELAVLCRLWDVKWVELVEGRAAVPWERSVAP
jgi:hypothetical protein